MGLVSQSRDIIGLHAITTIRNFDVLMSVRNLAYSGRCISNAGLKQQEVVRSWVCRRK